MPGRFWEKLEEAKKRIEEGVNPETALCILKMMGIDSVPLSVLENLRIYSDLLPVGVVVEPYTEEQRLLHFLWDALEKSPLSLIVDFSFPFRRAVAGKLFKGCGKHFCCETNVTFNFGHRISAGDDVFFNRNTFIDSKGFVEFGNGVALGEDVRIFTHSHSEASHRERTYAPVILKDYAKVYVGATILPGVTVGEQAIVAGHSVVTHDVPPNMVVAGTPAKVIRERKTEGHSREGLEHIWLHDGAFQRD
jgi:acetyltransferase-like isoleucine patch superfamily enzyme